MKKVIDISKHQGNIDFDKLSNSDICGVMCRCSYGGKIDSKFNEYYDNLSKRNISVGSYVYCTWHYASHSVNKASAMLAAESESNKVINILKDKNINGPIAIDLELESDMTTILSKEEMTQVANNYMDKLKSAGYSPILYCSISWIFDHLICDNLKYPLWVAYYNKEGFYNDEFPTTKYGALMYTIRDKIFMWQFTSHGDGKQFGTESSRIDISNCYNNFVTQGNDNPYNDSTGSPSFHIVQKNDNLTKIAKMHNITLKKLISCNPQIKNINIIHVGEKINLPNSLEKPLENSKICVGDIVKVKAGSKTYTDKKIASFVFNHSYRVDELKGNRAVLDLKGICTPVNVNDLWKIQ